MPVYIDQREIPEPGQLPKRHLFRHCPAIVDRPDRYIDRVRNTTQLQDRTDRCRAGCWNAYEEEERRSAAEDGPSAPQERSGASYAPTGNVDVHAAIGLVLSELAAHLRPVVEQRLVDQLERISQGTLTVRFSNPTNTGDPHVLLQLMERFWMEAFAQDLTKVDRGYVNELRDIRNRWAHHEPITAMDAFRVADSAARLLQSLGIASTGAISDTRSRLLAALPAQD